MPPTPRQPAASPTDQPGDDALVAHVERVLAARPPAPPGHPAAGPAEPRPPVRLRCAKCGWAIDCLASDRDRLTRRGCWMCGRALTVGRRGPAAGPPANKRRSARRRNRGGTWVEVRRPGPGRQPDLAVALTDLCAEGVGVWVAEPLRPGEPVEVSVTPPGGGPPVLRTAEVRWCAAGRDWTHRAGLRLSRHLTREELAVLAL